MCSQISSLNPMMMPTALTPKATQQHLGLAMSHPHYVYELRRTSSGSGPSRYVGVRTAQNCRPEDDVYWSSSKSVLEAIKLGAKFEKTIIRTFQDRKDAEFYEADLHWQLMVGKNPHFYNEFSQLIDGRVDDLYPRTRYISPLGEYRWFISGSEPINWQECPAQWAQFEDMSHKDQFSSSWRYTFKGLELPEWRFHKDYPDDLAFAVDHPRLGYAPYVQIDENSKVTDFRFFPIGYPPSGWIKGFARSFWFASQRLSSSQFLPSNWKRYRWGSGLQLGINDDRQNAFFPEGQQPDGWIDATSFEEALQRREDDHVTQTRLMSEFAKKIILEFNSHSDVDSPELQQAIVSIFNGNEKPKNFSNFEFILELSKSGMPNKNIWIIKNLFGI